MDRRLARSALRAVQFVAARIANRGAEPHTLQRHSCHDLLKAQRIAGFLADGDAVLDIGCGSGKRLHELQFFRNLDAHGVDLHDANCPYDDVERTTFDGENLEFADGAFDVVLICYVLHHLRPDHARRLLSEAVRVAKRELVLLEDSRPEWSLAYRLRNFAHRLESDLAYLAASEAYQPPQGQTMFLTHDEWREFLTDVPGIDTVDVIGLDDISQYAHHTMIRAALS